MKQPRTMIFLLVGSMILLTSCSGGQDSSMGSEMIEQMAKSDQVQQQFSEGRKDIVMHNDEPARHILHNTIMEQKAILKDKQLKEELMSFNMELTADMQRDAERNSQMVQQGLKSRQQAIQDDEKLRTKMLKQAVAEQKMVMQHPETSKPVKQLTMDMNRALAADPTYRVQLLKQSIAMSEAIAKNPTLRSEMADAMLLQMKDPKIQNEMKKMIELAVKQAMAKMQQQMMQQMKQMQQPSAPKEPPSNQPPAQPAQPSPVTPGTEAPLPESADNTRPPDA